ncbi:hypothetical protein [Bordetella trematum]|uniref:hypothetical protein n=1 Tax=Bordetella trematum TaxID=123899 RepID=UPI003AF3D196
MATKRTQPVLVPGQPVPTPTEDQNETAQATPQEQAGQQPAPVEPVAEPAPPSPEPDADVDAKPARQAKPVSRADYRNMRAADVDAGSLSAAVLTLDGWVVPNVAAKGKD